MAKVVVRYLFESQRELTCDRCGFAVSTVKVLLSLLTLQLQESAGCTTHAAALAGNGYVISEVSAREHKLLGVLSKLLQSKRLQSATIVKPHAKGI